MIKATIIAVILIALLATIVLAACNRKAPDPVRPDGLDKRLSLETMAEHDKLKPTAHKAYDIAAEVMESVYEELTAIDKRADAYHLISEPRQALYAAYWFEAEINNGGLSQYYFNSAGNQAAKAPKYLRALGLNEAADILEEANAFFPSATPPRDRRARLAILDAVEERASQTWYELEERFYQSAISFQPNMITYIRNNRQEFYKLN
jgi:hypothetical protein